MTKYLLDANILIALVTDDHDHRARAGQWFANQSSVAICPVVQGAFVRYSIVNRRSGDEARKILQGLQADPRFEFWPDSVSYADTDLQQVKGHQQVTDAYLVALTRTHADAKLATMDVALAATYPDVVELIP